MNNKLIVLRFDLNLKNVSPDSRIEPKRIRKPVKKGLRFKVVPTKEKKKKQALPLTTLIMQEGTSTGSY